MGTSVPSLRRNFWGSGLLWAGTVVVILASSADARQPSGAKQESQKASNAQLREGLQVLQTTKKVLEGADHDYGGHRVDAIKAIRAAEHQLRLALSAQHKRTPGGAKNGTGGQAKQPEAQNVSNLQLANAIGILQQTQTLLEKANHDYGGHKAAAIRDLSVAIQQLKTALRFEKSK
jgi:hypothetical protein